LSLKSRQVIVVGAGPSGLLSAREASKRGAEVLVLEEHPEVGIPCHCAGLLSLNGLERLKIPTDYSYVQNMVRGAIFYSPSGLSLKVERDRPVACVVDRSLFDKFLASQAEMAGAEIRLNSKVYDISMDDLGVHVSSKPDRFMAEILIDAEGISSRLVRAAGLEPLNSACLLPALQFDLGGVSVNPEYVEVHLGRQVAPGFFAWLIPLSRDSVRVGLGCKGANPRLLLNRFIQRRFKDEEYEVLAVRSGTIVTSGPIKRTFADRLLIVGDAAGQVKPTTGGGVILGGICGMTAGNVAAEAVRLGRFNSDFLASYERNWRGMLGREFRYMLWARRMLNALSDRMIDKLFEFIKKEDLCRVISDLGDMDFQSGVISELIHHGRIFKMLTHLLGLGKPQING